MLLKFSISYLTYYVQFLLERSWVSLSLQAAAHYHKNSKQVMAIASLRIRWKNSFHECFKRKNTCISVAFLNCSNCHVEDKIKLLCFNARLTSRSKSPGNKLEPLCICESLSTMLHRLSKACNLSKGNTSIYLSISLNNKPSEAEVCTNGFADSITLIPSLYAKYLFTCIGTYKNTIIWVSIFLPLISQIMTLSLRCNNLASHCNVNSIWRAKVKANTLCFVIYLWSSYA